MIVSNSRYVILVTLVLFASYFNFCESAGQSIDVCLGAGNNCEACIAIPGCVDKYGTGYCGMYDAEGWCVPGNINGSNIADQGADEECPLPLWKFANGTSQCYEPQRFIEVVVDTSIEKELVSRPIPGNTQLQNAADTITWTFSVDVGIGPNFTLAYSFQNDTTTGFYSLQSLWIELFEYLDIDGGGFTCDYSNTSCSDAANIVRSYFLADADFTLDLTTTLVNQTTNFEKYQIMTIQGNLSEGIQAVFACVVVNTNTTNSNQDYNPYEANCAFSVDNWPASSDPRSRFGIHGYLLSETPIAVSSDTSHKKLKQLKKKSSPLPSFIGRKEPWEYTVGNKLASFVWGDGPERNATVNSAGVSVFASDLFDDNSFLPSYDGFKKSFVISFGGANPETISWDPLYHITPFGFPGFVMDSSGSTFALYMPLVFLICVLLV